MQPCRRLTSTSAKQSHLQHSHFKHVQVVGAPRLPKSQLLPRAFTDDTAESRSMYFNSDDDAGTSSLELEDEIYQYTKSHDYRVEAPRDALPLIILPGFGNCSADYAAPFGDEESSLVTALKSRGFKPYVLPIERKDWFKVGRMVFTLNYWKGSCTTSPGYIWYLNRVKELVDTARRECGTDKVNLIGHSAGGWLARAFLGQLDFKDDPLSSTEQEPHEGVSTLISLGAPHTPPPPGNPSIKDMTGGALTYTNQRWPGAFYKDDGVKYLSVAGRTVVGNKDAPRRSLNGYAAGAYMQVAGDGHNVVGDGVVPLESALLEGSRHIVVDGVYHSMSKIRTFDEPGENVWYGSDDVLDLWLRPLVEGCDE